VNWAFLTPFLFHAYILFADEALLLLASVHSSAVTDTLMYIKLCSVIGTSGYCHSYCLCRTCLRTRHTLSRQPDGREVLCIFTETSSMAILVPILRWKQDPACWTSGSHSGDYVRSCVLLRRVAGRKPELHVVTTSRTIFFRIQEVSNRHVTTSVAPRCKCNLRDVLHAV
jgi:hypothetical protein